MGRISVGEALGAGFRLIGREPMAFAAWCCLYLLIYLAPQLANGPATLQMYGALAAGADPAEVQAAADRAARLEPIALLLLLAVFAVLPPAVFRAVLMPDERRFFYLRLGMREFWVVNVSIVVALIWFLALVGAVIPVAIMGGLGVIAGGTGGAVGGLIALVIGYIAILAFMIWVALRFSMAPIMSFAENTFRVPESWRLTKGHGWRLFLVGLGLFAITLLGQIVLVGIGLAALAAGTRDFMQTLQTNPAALFAEIGLPVMFLAAVVFSVFSVATYVLGAAAWADIYRQLKPPLAETFT